MKKIITAVCFVCSAVLGAALGIQYIIKKKNSEIQKYKKLSEKHFALFQLMNQWVRIKQNGKSISKWLLDHDCKTVAVYGMSFVGETLIEELQNTDIEVLYGIDRGKNFGYSDLEIIKPEEIKENADAVIVTAVTSFDQIAESLLQQTTARIISLDDILYDFE